MRITGFLSDVRSAISICDVMVLVSHSETFSVAALEAMALGKPMIMSDIGGANEQVVEGVNGFLYPPKHIDALIERIRQMNAPCRRKRMGAAARKMVIEHFSIERMIQQYTMILEDLVA